MKLEENKSIDLPSFPSSTQKEVRTAFSILREWLNKLNKSINSIITILNNAIDGVADDLLTHTLDTTTHGTTGDIVGTTDIQTLSNKSLITPFIDRADFNTGYSNPSPNEGQIWWNSTDGTFNLELYNDVTLQAGQEMHFYSKANGAISNGDLCMFAGVQGSHALVKKAIAAEVIANPHYLMGIATQDIANNDFGYITSFGKINGVFTKAPDNQDSVDWLAGDILYFDNTTGQMTKTAPNAPEIRIVCAVVVKEQTGASETGILLVRPSAGIKLVDCDDVDGNPADTTGQILIWDNTNQYWNPSENIIIVDSTRTLSTNTSDLTISCGTDKTVLLAEPCWIDVNFPITARTAQANQPTPATLSGNITAPTWAINDYFVCEGNELIHMWKEGSEVFWHVHMITNGLDGTNRYVRFEVEYVWANGGSALAGATITSSDILIPANTTDRTHIVGQIGSFTPSGGAVQAQVYARLKRIAAVGTAPTNNPFIPMLQLHIEVDTLGSRQRSAK